ncbi:MAG: hypothetical protein H7Y08_10920 [Rhizobiaceae bacterium]|nr:hypothetical protein [Rhizobiaceae bacterium]
MLSLGLNLNPLMRFDGYYMLADLLGVENLLPRAFQHMVWRMRRLLFGLDAPPPENLPQRLDAIRTVYAIPTAIYRFVLCVGIALLVYHFAIKIVGITLFVVEVAVFLIAPVHRERTEWRAMRHDIIGTRRSRITLGLGLGGLVLVFAPLSTKIEAPAILRPAVFTRLHPQEAGRIERSSVHEGQTVRAGARHGEPDRASSLEGGRSRGRVAETAKSCIVHAIGIMAPLELSPEADETPRLLFRSDRLSHQPACLSSGSRLSKDLTVFRPDPLAA